MRVPVLNRLSPRLRKLTFWLVGLVLAYTLIGSLVLPPIIRSIAVRQLSKQLNREVSIRKVKLNPYTLSATIRGLLIKDKDGEPFAAWDEVYANLQLASFLGHPWVFKEVSITRPFVRVQENTDFTFNFSDLLTNSAAKPAASQPSKPLALRIGRFRVISAWGSLTDLTPRVPFQRLFGPIDVSLLDFRTDPAHPNCYAFSGASDAGERFLWNGAFHLQPLQLHGDFSLENLVLNKFAPLYQDLVRFQIQDGAVDFHTTYHLELGGTNNFAWITNTSFSLHSLKVTEPGGAGLLELPEFTISGISADAGQRQAEIASVSATGARFEVRRAKDNSFNLVEVAKPAETARASGGVLLLLQAVTNMANLLLNSTNAWVGIVDNIQFHDGALSLEDLSNPRPVHLQLDQFEFSARHLSNLSGSNLVAAFSMRWNTNGSIKSDLQAALAPIAADLDINLDQLDLSPLSPYLEPRFDLRVQSSKLGADGHLRVRAANSDSGLPDVTFAGNARLDDFSTVDAMRAEDLVKWDSVRVSGVEAGLTPQQVNVKQIAVDGLSARVIVETNHVLNLLAVLHAGSTKAPANEKGSTPRPGMTTLHTNEPPARVLPKFALGELAISNAAVRFTDQSITPNVNMDISQAGGTITGISSELSARPELSLSARVDQVGPVDITGTINPLNLNQTNEIKLTARNVDLTPTSPYVGRFAGYRLNEGKLQLDLHYHLNGRELKSENIIVLNRFTLGEKVPSPDATKLPVRLVIAILKDRQGKITLDVPIEGNLNDPKFRLHKVIVGALENLVSKIATSPFAALSAVFGGHGEDMSYQEFAAGSAELQPATRDKLDSLIKGLYERPGLQLEIAGSIDPDKDRDALRRLELEKRLRNSKWASLRESERNAIAPDRMTLTPEERLRWLRQLYTEAVAKGEIVPGGQPTNQVLTAAGRPALTDTATSRPAPSMGMDFEHAASGFMRRAQPSAPTPTPVRGPPPSPRRMSADALETALLQTTALGESSLQQLATQRAKAVHDYVLQSGKVEPERVSLAAPTSGPKTQGTRAYLELQ